MSPDNPKPTTQPLPDALLEQIERARRIHAQFESIGAPGELGKRMIAHDIQQAQHALAAGDVVGMIRTYQALSELKE